MPPGRDQCPHSLGDRQGEETGFCGGAGFGEQGQCCGAAFDGAGFDTVGTVDAQYAWPLRIRSAIRRSPVVFVV